jgi:hypothetical protein
MMNAEDKEPALDETVDAPLLGAELRWTKKQI